MDKVIKIECTGTENIDLDNLTDYGITEQDILRIFYDEQKNHYACIYILYQRNI